jgi:ATP adenylyltransferase
MDRLWSPWRYRYVSTCGTPGGCIFCDKPADGDDEKNLIIHRGRLCYVLLNLYPYTNGHLMVAPYAHVAELEDLDAGAAVELITLAQTSVRHLKSAYQPHGLNVGMNLGECAGAGVAGHLHMHIVPRWVGDANFMTVVGETRVMPEDLAGTYSKLKSAFAGHSA